MGNLDFDRRTLTLLAAVLVGAVVVTLFVMGRGRVPQAAPVAAAGALPTISAAPVVSASASPAGDVVVEVVGKVRRPGVVTLNKGSRVLDALEAVGGTRPGVDTSDQNLARVLVDGEQIRIGLEPVPATVTAPGTATSGAPIDINTASLEALQAIPGVGPVIATRIVTYREQNGGFQSVEQLMEVSGIGEATFAQMQPMVTVGAGG
ncbi:MAG TPA: helix-hairpin-helix domain-containing protein [Actinomycetota bacterium]|nr:helix-hairpin-helix domain-containing protein [Actinomycetota bacterium]